MKELTSEEVSIILRALSYAGSNSDDLNECFEGYEPVTESQLFELEKKISRLTSR